MRCANDVVADWTIRAVRALTGHYDSARAFEKWARILTVVSLVTGLIAAVLTAAILSANDPSSELRLAAVIAAAGASGLGLLQSQLNLGTRAEQHLRAGAGYSEIGRLLETLDKTDANVLKSPEFHRVRELYAQVSRSAPIIPGHRWESAHAGYPKSKEAQNREIADVDAGVATTR
jgi:hypothetical protein